jgi:ribosomal protein L35
MKTNKALLKRIKITSTGKVLVRKGGKNHFNAKESRSKQLANKGWVTLKISKKELSRYIPTK